jgi:hypothetical protein
MSTDSERESVSPEELPPLELRKLRDLDITREEGDERAPFIASASAVVRRADYTYVIGDDELDIAVFELSTGEPGEMRRALPGELPEDPEERKEEKPDLEALTMLPPFDGAPFGALLGLGSGSKRVRDRGFFWELDARGALAGNPTTIDLHPLYERLRDELTELNVEGAAVLGERFLVFHRGNDEESENAIVDLALDKVMASLTGDSEIDVEDLDRIRVYDLGELGGTKLCFSDATPLSDDLVVFTASAEVDDDTTADGTIRGSVVGTVDADGGIQRLRTIDRRWKVEGVHAAIDTGVIDFVFVCDQDSETEPSPLLSATMPIEGGFEHSG